MQTRHFRDLVLQRREWKCWCLVFLVHVLLLDRRAVSTWLRSCDGSQSCASMRWAQVNGAGGWGINETRRRLRKPCRGWGRQTVARKRQRVVATKSSMELGSQLVTRFRFSASLAHVHRWWLVRAPCHDTYRRRPPGHTVFACNMGTNVNVTVPRCFMLVI